MILYIYSIIYILILFSRVLNINWFVPFFFPWQCMMINMYSNKQSTFHRLTEESDVWWVVEPEKLGNRELKEEMHWANETRGISHPIIILHFFG